MKAAVRGVWEYKSLLIETKGFVRRGLIDVEQVDATLAAHGRGGWELAAVVPVGDGAVGTARLLYTFKRPGPPPPAPAGTDVGTVPHSGHRSGVARRS